MGEEPTGPYETSSSNTSGQRVSVDEAARVLGLSVDAVRKRVQRGTIEHEKDAGGRVWILLDTSSTLHDEVHNLTGHSPDRLLDAKVETIEELRDRVRRLERELDIRTEEVRRRDHLLAAALERIPAIEAPEEPRETPETASEAPGSGDVPPEQETGTERRSWWKRMFGG